MLVEPVHKERGIFEIMKRYNVSDDRIVVFGDGLNDCSMFRPEWMTVAMGNAKPVLKKKARYITDDADDDGIYNACRHFGVDMNTIARKTKSPFYEWRFCFHCVRFDSSRRRVLFYKQKYDCRRENILYCIVNEKRKGIIDKSCVFP